MKWYFIRHGEIDSNRQKIYSGRSEEALNQAGIQQARDVSKDIEPLQISAIYTSPLKRTVQTTEIILNHVNMKIPVQSDDSFNELKMGPWEGMAESDVASRYPKEWEIWHKSPANLKIDGRETLQQLQDRVIQGLRAIEQKNDYEAVLVVTHVAIIRVVCLFANHSNLNAYKSVTVENAKLLSFEEDLLECLPL